MRLVAVDDIRPLGEPELARVAAIQRGVLSVNQISAAGFDRDEVEYRCRTGRLHRLTRGVYLLGHADPAPLARETAAILALGPHALLSHDTAVELRLGRPLPPTVDVTVLGRRPRPRAGIRRHLAPSLHRSDWSLVDGLPVTSMARTLVDLAATADPDRLERLIAEALATRRVTERQLRQARERATDRRGRAALAAAVGGGHTRSEGERALLRLIAAARLPSPEVNVRLGAWEVDLLWREQRVIVELDGRDGHSSAWARDRDARKTAELELAGWTVMRITGRQLHGEPEWVLATLAALLAVRG